jgi:hypothetical protein
MRVIGERASLLESVDLDGDPDVWAFGDREIDPPPDAVVVDELRLELDVCEVQAVDTPKNLTSELVLPAVTFAQSRFMSLEEPLQDHLRFGSRRFELHDTNRPGAEAGLPVESCGLVGMSTPTR